MKITIGALSESYAMWCMGKEVPTEVKAIEKFFLRWALEINLSEMIKVNGKSDVDFSHEKEYLEIFNRIKKSFCGKRNIKFAPTRLVSKPTQLHARLNDYSMEELGKVIYGAFSDNYHIETKWKYVTTEYITRLQTIEKYL